MVGDDDPSSPAPGPEPTTPVPTSGPAVVCPDAPAGPPAGVEECEGQVPDGVADADDAEAIFWRGVHEAEHLLEDIEELDGIFEETSDSGYMFGELWRSSDASACAVVRFGCWTGGHGGFGPTGLHGVATLRFDEGQVEVTGRLGLVELDALSGAPCADVARGDGWGRGERKRGRIRAVGGSGRPSPAASFQAIKVVK